MKYGNQDGLTLCGTRSYEILDLQDRHSNYISYANRILEMKSTDDGDIGVHEIVVKAFLNDYPEISSLYSFKLTINPCTITEFTGVVKPTKLNYQIGAPSVNSFKMTFTQLDSCGYTENIQIVTDLPEFVTFNQDTNDFTIVSDDINHNGVFALAVNATIEVP